MTCGIKQQQQFNYPKHFQNKQSIKMLQHNQQPPTTSLSHLCQFLTEISSHFDPYWQTILQSDLRNIIPKHQVCKIEMVKNGLNKTRLIMENLNTFISLEVQKKHLKEEMVDLNENIAGELEVVVRDQRQSSGDRRFHYDTGMNKRKKQLQVIAKELSRSKTSNELKILIEKNMKWRQYIEKHVKELQKAQQANVHADIANFIQTYEEMFMVEGNGLYQPCKETIDQVVLKSGNYVKMYENKLEERILIQKLLDDVYGTGKQTMQMTDQDQYWKQEVLKIRKIHDI